MEMAEHLIDFFKDCISCAKSIGTNFDHARTIFLFIGASPGYIYQAFHVLYPMSHHFVIPLSRDKSTGAKKIVRTQRQFTLFDQYVKEIIRMNSQALTIEFELVIVDFASRGTFMNDFITNFLRSFPENDNITFINVVDQEMTEDMLPLIHDKIKKYFILQSKYGLLTGVHAIPRSVSQYVLQKGIIQDVGAQAAQLLHSLQSFTRQHGRQYQAYQLRPFTRQAIRSADQYLSASRRLNMLYRSISRDSWPPKKPFSLQKASTAGQLFHQKEGFSSQKRGGNASQSQSPNSQPTVQSNRHLNEEEAEVLREFLTAHTGKSWIRHPNPSTRYMFIEIPKIEKQILKPQLQALKKSYPEILPRNFQFKFETPQKTYLTYYF